MKAILKHLLGTRRFKLLIEIIFFIVLFSAINSYIQRDLITGTPPLFEGTLLNGQSINLPSFQGKPLLLHFWATWCGVCKLEEDSIAEISKTHQVLTIAMKSGSSEDIKRYLTKRNLEFPVIADKKGIIADRFGVRGVPTSFIVDPLGTIKYSMVGYTTGWGLKIRLWMSQD